MARKKRNIIEEIKTKVLINFLCIKLDIGLSSGELSEYFEGTRRNSSKWKRYITGEHSISNGTLDLILSVICEKEKLDKEHLVQQIKELFYSPLWVALESGDKNIEFWLEFYRSLPINLQQYVFLKNSPSDRTFPNEAQLPPIERICTLESLALLVGLARETRDKLSGFHIVKLERPLVRVLLFTLQESGFYQCRFELVRYFIEHVFLPNHELRVHIDAPLNNFRISEKALDDLIENDIAITEAAQRFGIVKTEREKQLFYFYRFHLERSSIDKVNIEIFYLQKKKFREYPTLNKIITKLNRRRADSQQIPLILPTELDLKNEKLVYPPR